MNKILKFALLLILLLSNFGCASKKTLLIGDYYVLSKIDGNINYTFNKMTTQKLYYMLENNAADLNNKEKINKSIRKSKDIILSFGIYDLIVMFDFSQSDVQLSESKIEQKFQLMDYYLYNSFSLIKESKKTNSVYVLQQINPLIRKCEELDIYISRLNHMLLDFSNKFEFIFVQLSELSSYLIDDFLLSENSACYINQSIYG